MSPFIDATMANFSFLVKGVSEFETVPKVEGLIS